MAIKIGRSSGAAAPGDGPLYKDQNGADIPDPVAFRTAISAAAAGSTGIDAATARGIALVQAMIFGGK